MRHADIEAATKIGEKIRIAVEQLLIEIAPGRFARVTASLGVVSTLAGDLERSTLMRMADQALYRAKQLGRNRVVAANELCEAPPADPLIDPGSAPAHR